MIKIISSYKNSRLFILLFTFIFAFSLSLSGCKSPQHSESDEPERALRGNDGEEFVKIPVNTFPDPPEGEKEGEEKNIFEQYRIAPGDVLDVLYQANTWRKRKTFKLSVGNVVNVKFVRHSSLNQKQSIRPDGTISLPHLGEIDATGKTVQQLTKDLQNKYSKILKHPEIYVVVPEFRKAIKELKKDLHTAPRGLSRLTTVRPDGYATFPLLGDIKVEGRTIPDVRQELDKKYEKTISGMSVDLFLQEHAGRRIYVLGAVEKPGAYEISRPTTVAESLALAGSYLDSANLEQVVVMRRQQDEILGRSLNLEKALRLKEKAHFFYLRPDDIVYVPRRSLNRWATVAREIGDVIFFRGWSAGVSASYELNDKGGSN